MSTRLSLAPRGEGQKSESFVSTGSGVAQVSPPVTVTAGDSPAGRNTNRDGRWHYGGRDGGPTTTDFASRISS